MKELTFLDILKGLVFCAIGLAVVFLFIIAVGLIFSENIFNIENPLYLIVGIAIFLVVYCLMVAFSKIKTAGYSKNIFSEFYHLIMGK